MARADAELNRRQLVLAARDAVAEEGPTVSVRDIADRAGVGVTTLYRHFPDKRGLIDGLSIYRWATMAQLARHDAANAEPLPAIVHLLETFTRMVTTDDAFILAVGLRVGHTPEGIRPFKARFDPLFATLWTTAQRRNQIRRSADPRDAMQLAGMIRDQQRRKQMLLTLINGICTDKVDAERVLAHRLRATEQL